MRFTVALQGEAALRIPEIGCKRLGLENHPRGHIRAPTLQRRSKLFEGLAPGAQVRRDGQSVRTRADDRSLHIQSHALVLRSRAGFAKTRTSLRQTRISPRSYR